MQKVTLLILFLALGSAACTSPTATQTPVATLAPVTLMPRQASPTAEIQPTPRQNQNLILSVSAPFVEIRECPQLRCAIIGRLEENTSLTAVSRSGTNAEPWVEIAVQGQTMGWIPLNGDQLVIPRGLWDSLNLNQFIVATATPKPN